MADKDRLRKRIFSIIVLIIVVILYIRILSFSFTPADLSAMQSITVSEYIINFIEQTLSINLNLSEVQFSRFEVFIRKAAHFSEYALLGFLIYTLPLIWEKKSGGSAFYTFLAVVLLASIDECVQFFVPGRAGRITDVMIDGAGGIFGILCVRLIYNIYVSRKAKRDVSRAF